MGNEGAREIFEACICGSTNADGSRDERIPSSALTHLDLRCNNFMPLVVNRLADLMAKVSHRYMHANRLRVIDMTENAIVDHRNNTTAEGLQALCKSRRIRLML